MGLITSLIVGFIAFILVQYFARGLGIWVAIFVAGFIAGLLAEGIIKGLFVGLVIAVIGVFIAIYFFGGIPGLGTNIKDITNNLMGMVGLLIVGLSSLASIVGAKLRTSKFRR